MYFENMLLISNLLAGKYWLYSNRMKETLKTNHCIELVLIRKFDQPVNF